MQVALGKIHSGQEGCGVAKGKKYFYDFPKADIIISKLNR